jgi:hypothetical protein
MDGLMRELRRKNLQRFVYFVRAEGLDLFKIGVTNDPHARLASLKTNCPVPLKLVAVILATDAEETEDRVHRRFAHLRTAGEWFRSDPELVDFIATSAETPGACQQRLVNQGMAKVAAARAAARF